MPDNTKRLTAEESWATALAVIGGLAVLVPLIVFALKDRPQGEGAGAGSSPTATVETPAGPTGDPIKSADLPIPSSALAVRQELIASRKQIDALTSSLAVAKAEAEERARSAERAWTQLKEAAGEPASDDAIEEGDAS